eukprot:3885655-Pyramimonas_sp.AAC.1
MPRAGNGLGTQRGQQSGKGPQFFVGVCPSHIGPRGSGGPRGGEERDFDRVGGSDCDGDLLPG